MKPGDVIEWVSDNGLDRHLWKIRGIHLGALGVESLIEIENITHRPGWTGEWMTHQIMFIPECLLRCRIIEMERVN